MDAEPLIGHLSADKREALPRSEGMLSEKKKHADLSREADAREKYSHLEEISHPSPPLGDTTW